MQNADELNKSLISQTFSHRLTPQTEMVPDPIWALDFFGPQVIWAQRNLDPQKFEPCIKKPCVMTFMHLGAQNIRAQMRLGTISVVAPKVFASSAQLK